MPKDFAGQCPLLSPTGSDLMLSLSSSAVPDEGGHFFRNETALPALATGHYPVGRWPCETGVWFPWEETPRREGDDYRPQTSALGGREAHICGGEFQTAHLRSPKKSHSSQFLANQGTLVLRAQHQRGGTAQPSPRPAHR